mmetsp:Transcript_45826/g.105836  ORF Transcript_45826/g.105836 Transcript_45826/m.105836 type:complete len:316 (-) Transcript_45826:59-1006(-)
MVSQYGRQIALMGMVKQHEVVHEGRCACTHYLWHGGYDSTKRSHQPNEAVRETCQEGEPGLPKHEDGGERSVFDERLAKQAPLHGQGFDFVDKPRENEGEEDNTPQRPYNPPRDVPSKGQNHHHAEQDNDDKAHDGRGNELTHETGVVHDGNILHLESVHATPTLQHAPAEVPECQEQGHQYDCSRNNYTCPEPNLQRKDEALEPAVDHPQLCQYEACGSVGQLLATHGTTVGVVDGLDQTHRCVRHLVEQGLQSLCGADHQVHGRNQDVGIGEERKQNAHKQLRREEEGRVCVEWLNHLPELLEEAQIRRVLWW